MDLLELTTEKQPSMFQNITENIYSPKATKRQYGNQPQWTEVMNKTKDADRISQ